MANSIALSEILIDGGTQVRAGIDQQVVSDYAEAMTSGAQFPPIVVFRDGSHSWLADGFHRVMAAQRLSLLDIQADVRQGTKDDAVWFALGANRENGKRLTEADKTHAVEMALVTWPDRMHSEIAAQVGCSKSLVSKVSSRYTSESGGTLTGRARANDAKREAVRTLVKQGGLARDEIAAKASVSESFVSKVRAEMGESCYDRSREGAVRRLARMRTMAEEGNTSRQIAAAVGMSEDNCRNTLKRESIDVPADKVTRGTHRHDSNRIVERMVMDAENLTEGINLIDFSELDRGRLSEWLGSLSQSRDKFGSFIRRLMKEQQRNGEAA